MADNRLGPIELGTEAPDVAPVPTTIPGGEPGRPEVRAPSGPRTPLIELGRESPATFLQRAGASIPRTTEGKVQFLERTFGEGNVVTTPRGEILIRDPRGTFVPFDERNITFTDVTADILGPAIETVPAVAGGSTVAGAAAGAAAGSVLRTVAGELVTGGETGETLGEQALETGITALTGAGGQLAARGASAVIDAFRPSNVVGRPSRRFARTPFGRRGERLSRETGIEFTPGEQTGSRAALMMEALGRRTFGGADEFFAFHQNQLRTAMKRLQEAMERIKPGEAGAFQTGSDVAKAFDDMVENATTLRRNQARLEFGEATRLSDGAPVIPTRNLAQQIQDAIDELDLPGTGNKQVVKDLKEFLEELTEGGSQRITGEHAQRLLEVYGNAQRGVANIIPSMTPAQNRRFGTMLREALERDLDVAVDEAARSGQAANVATALRTARDNYRLNSAAIDRLTESTLARLVGTRGIAPETIAERIVTRMQPSEVASVMEIVERASPETAAGVRRLFIENAIDRARPPVTQQAASGIRFSAARFLSNLPDLRVMRAAGFSRQEIVEIGRIAKALERVADKVFEGSPTTPLALAWDTLRGSFTLNPATLARSAATVFAPRWIARATLTPEGRAALMTVTRTGETPKRIAQAVATLTAIGATEPGAENVRPLGPDVTPPGEDMGSILRENGKVSQ